MAARDTKGQYTALEMKAKESEKEQASSQSHWQITGNLEDEFDKDFWVEVRRKFKEDNVRPWSHAMDEVRVARLIKRFRDNGSKPDEDPLLIMCRDWPKDEKFKGKPELVEQQVKKFAKILLSDDNDMNKDNRYERLRDISNDEEKTLLHYAAEQNFYHLASTLMKYCPGLLALKTEPVLAPVKKAAMLPVEVALMKENDDVAAVMIRRMSHERIQSLFFWRPDNPLQSPRPSLFSFQKILASSKMKKSSVAILDCMVNPHWPFLPERKGNYDCEEEEDAIEGAWGTIPDDPLDYHFFYHVIDGDCEGRPPKIPDDDTPKKMINNTFFNRKSRSCLNVIAKSKNMDAIQHPVVRMLISAKWKAYGHFILCIQALVYVLFLGFLSCALIQGSTLADPRKYSGHGDRARGFCEVAVLIMLLLYLIEEVNQMSREQAAYFKDVYNYFDWLGVIFIWLMVPLRVVNHDAQWVLASLGYLFNFFRIFKFSSVTRTTGLYTKTLARIIIHDISRFLVVFAVIFLSFSGALFLSLRAYNNQHLIGGFEQVLLSGIRTLAEQQPISEDFSKFKWLSILLMMSYMGTVAVVLLNILIAQLSTTYTQAKKRAKLEYDVDRMLLLTRMENYPFLNLRVRYYKEGDWISEMNLAKELLEFSEDRHPLETIEQKLEMLRGLMRKIVKTIKPVSSIEK